MDKLDTDILEAMKALESTVPDSYFDQFETRLEARLEVEAMAGPEMMEQGVGMDDSPPPVSPPEPKEENTGLHDIKELARSQKKRISKRMSTESDLEQSLLASSSALSAVALPEPGKDKRTFETKGAKSSAKTATAADLEAAAASPAAREDSRGLPVWIYAAVGVVAAAAVVFFVVRGGKDDSKSGDQSVALNDTAAAGDKKGDSASATAGGTQPTKSLGAAGDTAGTDSKDEVTPDDGDSAGDPEGAGDDPAMVAEADVDDDDKSEGGRSGLTRDDDKDRKADRDAKKKKDRDKKKADKKKDKKDKAAKKDTKKDDKKDTKKDDKADDKKKDTSGSGEPSLDDLLNDASGGAVDTSGGKKDVVKKPTKKKLSSSDIKRGMKPIMGSAKACYDGEPGTVKIKFSVDPSGKVTKAYATGKFKGTTAGTCIARLVKGASFPAFDGRTSSFSFPFLLTQ